MIEKGIDIEGMTHNKRLKVQRGQFLTALKTKDQGSSHGEHGVSSGLPKTLSMARVTCVVTGFGRAVQRRYRRSRFERRERALKGDLPGVMKKA